MYGSTMINKSIHICKNQSILLSVGSVESGTHLQAEKLGCQLGALPALYLSLPLGAKYSSLLCGTEWEKGIVRD